MRGLLVAAGLLLLERWSGSRVNGRRDLRQDVGIRQWAIAPVVRNELVGVVLFSDRVPHQSSYTSSGGQPRRSAKALRVRVFMSAPPGGKRFPLMFRSGRFKV